MLFQLIVLENVCFCDFETKESRGSLELFVYLTLILWLPEDNAIYFVDPIKWWMDLWMAMNGWMNELRWMDEWMNEWTIN